MNIREKAYRQKIIGISNEGKTKKIIVTHVTIRQSIFFLLLKLFLIEILAALSILIYLVYILPGDLISRFGIDFFAIPVFTAAVVIKTSFTFFIIIQWLEEYYEITPVEIIHRNGFIIKKEKAYRLEHLGSLEIDQNIFGRIFNYGTLRLYNWALDKQMYLYLIHNPKKYHKILENLLPNVDTKKDVFREQLVELENDE